MSTVAWTLVAVAWATPTQAETATPKAPPSESVRGITISTHRGGGEWATDAMPPTLAAIEELGANWVAIHPYAGIGADGSVNFRPFTALEPPQSLTRPIAEAHARGLKILIKPHLAYWRSGFSWRGEIDFDDDASWQRFWSDYERWILLLVETCRDADGFVVGTELDRTLRFEDRWRRLIRGVRERTTVPLTYAANWTDYERVTFWDALDVIGIQAYFPLSDRDDPDLDELRRSWQERMRHLRDYASGWNRNVLFTELGYNRSYKAAREPWSYETNDEGAEALQRRCLEAALLEIEDEPWVVGAFLWKWFPEPRPVGRDFQMAAPAVREVIRRAWVRAAP